MLASAASCAGSKEGIAAAGGAPGGGVAVAVPRTLARTASMALAVSALDVSSRPSQQLVALIMRGLTHFSSAFDLTPSMAMISGGSWPGAGGGDRDPAGDCVPEPECRPL